MVGGGVTQGHDSGNNLGDFNYVQGGYGENQDYELYEGLDVEQSDNQGRP